MTGRIYFILSLVATMFMLTSCQAVGDVVKFIFAAGFWLGVILVIAVVALIIFIIRKLF